MQPIPILYEDNHLLVVNKPANIPVQADSSGDPDVLTILKNHLKEKFNKPGDVFLGLVHRLDRPTQGVMVFARTSKAASRLSDQFRRRTVEKIYRAVVVGNAPDQGELHDFLWKDRDKNLVLVVESSHPDAKPASLSFKTLSKKSGLSLIEIELETGRSHQIRVQCANAGFPLWGDYRYGVSGQPQHRTMALLSYSLQFDHPTKKERMEFKVGMPDSEPWVGFL
jgi:23S rRNA pseudouridine1911/1915/1917 synthase